MRVIELPNRRRVGAGARTHRSKFSRGRSHQRTLVNESHQPTRKDFRSAEGKAAITRSVLTAIEFAITSDGIDPAAFKRALDTALRVNGVCSTTFHRALSAPRSPPPSTSTKRQSDDGSSRRPGVSPRQPHAILLLISLPLHCHRAAAHSTCCCCALARQLPCI
jgi:hypothetical protein